MEHKGSNLTKTFQGHFKDLSKTFQVLSKDISGTFQRPFKDFLKTFHRHSQNISKTFLGLFKDILGTFQRHFKDFPKTFRKYFNIVDLCGILPYKRMCPHSCGRIIYNCISSPFLYYIQYARAKISFIMIS